MQTSKGKGSFMGRTELLVVVILVTAFAACPHADADLALQITGAGGLKYDETYTHGWEFTTHRELRVSELGLYDFQQNGLGVEHEVGLFRSSDQQLLASVFVGPGTDDPLEGGFRYAGLASPLTLEASEKYFVGALYYPMSHDMDYAAFLWSFDSSPPGSISVHPAISLDQEGFDQTGPGLAFPTEGPRRPDDLHISSNFRFEVVPVPAAVLLGALGLGCAGWRLRRRTR